MHQLRVYLHLVIDDYSRFIVGHRLGETITSEDAVTTLQGAIARHGKLPEALARDIADYVALFPGEPLAILHRLFVRDNAELCREHGHPELSYGAFCRASGRSKNKPEEARKKPERGRDAPENLPYQALALMDTTDLACFGFNFKLVPFMEAHSRAIFAHELCERERAEQIAQVLDQGVDQALVAMAARGLDAYRLATMRLVDQEHDRRVLGWMRDRMEAAHPPSRTMKEDLLL